MSPIVSDVGLHDLTPADIHVGTAGTTAWAELGPVTVFGSLDELAEIGREITRKAEAHG